MTDYNVWVDGMLSGVVSSFTREDALEKVLGWNSITIEEVIETEEDDI